MNLEFGKRIAVLRKMHGVTQAQLAEYLMVQPQTVSRWESDGGTPDVAFLPKIAAFFSVSMDELFGMTDMEQIDNLVYKYSVLRDEKSLEEVLRRIELALDTLEGETAPESMEKREQLLAWKVHIYIQKSRKAQEEAESILDELMQKAGTESKLSLALRLQKNQFLIQKGNGRAVLREMKAAWQTEQTLENLRCYMTALMEMDRAEDIVELWDQKEVQELVCKVTEESTPLWQMMFWAVATEGRENCFKNRLEIFKEAAEEAAVFEAEWTWTGFLKEAGREEEKEKGKKHLLELLERLPFNEYLKMNYKKRIQEV